MKKDTKPLVYQINVRGANYSILTEYCPLDRRTKRCNVDEMKLPTGATNTGEREV
jgi:hypothetical protein